MANSHAIELDSGPHDSTTTTLAPSTHDSMSYARTGHFRHPRLLDDPGPTRSSHGWPIIGGPEHARLFAALIGLNPRDSPRPRPLYKQRICATCTRPTRLAQSQQQEEQDHWRGVLYARPGQCLLGLERQP